MLFRLEAFFKMIVKQTLIVFYEKTLTGYSLLNTLKKKTFSLKILQIKTMINKLLILYYKLFCFVKSQAIRLLKEKIKT